MDRWRSGRLKIFAAGLLFTGVGVARMIEDVQVVTHWTGQPLFSWGLIAAGGICFLFAAVPTSWINKAAHNASRRQSGTGHPTIKIVPADDTIADLEKNAVKYEEQANEEQEPIAALLREKAEKCRQWVTSLRTGMWKS